MLDDVLSTWWSLVCSQKASAGPWHAFQRRPDLFRDHLAFAQSTGRSVALGDTHHYPPPTTTTQQMGRTKAQRCPRRWTPVHCRTGQIRQTRGYASSKISCYRSWDDLALVQGRLDHAVADAVLHTGAGFHDLQLGCHLSHVALGDLLQVHHGRPACMHNALSTGFPIAWPPAAYGAPCPPCQAAWECGLQSETLQEKRRAYLTHVFDLREQQRAPLFPRSR